MDQMPFDLIADEDADPAEQRKLIEIDLAWELHRQQMGMIEPARPKIKGRAGRRLFERVCGEQNWRCCHCGVRTNEAGAPKQQPTWEHIIPRCIGGSNEYENLAMACLRCNNARGHDMNWRYEP